ncbi:hypothetical protein [Chengkuizengella axinellae]|uniref:Aldose 1-epimerase n=1 Tax=Chengkuizengella axinellae TaxID=3064388 RepID=A0ABT9J0K3_9BACL|nr:hypothetical protein [Chengkuizengella sp. 2205SS18-9]MDP5275151.1 hypothetical protein [Chengkuizengella sp. 2205SS18-9]
MNPSKHEFLNPPSFILQNDKLKVNIAKPGAFQKGSRFDWTGYITQVTLNDKHTFCVPETYEPERGTEGQGLCNEFGIFTPIGYEEASVGEQFPKLGIGNLTRTDEEEYQFHSPYPIFPFEIEVTQEENKIQFKVSPDNCRGYATEIEKTIIIQDQSLTIDYRLQNVGVKTIKTEEYVHNFVAINEHPISSDYKLRLPYTPIIESLPDIMTINHRELSWKNTPNEPFYCRPEGYSDSSHIWELTHEPSGVGMREINIFPPAMFAIWGTRHVVSPEIFIDIDVKPGETQTWSRTFEFFEE